MTQTSNRFYDRFAQLMNDASSVAQGVRREATTMFRSQAERMATDMDLVKREDFEAVKEMAQNAREENTRLEKRIAELEAELGIASSVKSTASASAKSSGSPNAGRSTTRRTASSGTTGTAKPRASRSRTTKSAGGVPPSDATSSPATDTTTADTAGDSKPGA